MLAGGRAAFNAVQVGSTPTAGSDDRSRRSEASGGSTVSDWPDDYTPLNGCGMCGRDFSGVRYFDAHRIGSHAYDFSAEHLDGRRCADDEELLALGIRPMTTAELLASRRTRARAGSGVMFYFDPAASDRMRDAFAEDEDA